jgi:secondary thiamine-phosphate synthase enzyme
MAVQSYTIHLATKGNADVTNITDEVEAFVKESGLRDGLVTVSVIGSTGALTTCEYEPGLVQDIKDIFEQLIPAGQYNHDQAWGDGNGHSHLRSSLVGPSVTFPFVDGRVCLGTWQQIIFIDFDNRARDRQLAVQIMGE